jgi:serine/threonine-protein kinase
MPHDAGLGVCPKTGRPLSKRTSSRSTQQAGAQVSAGVAGGARPPAQRNQRDLIGQTIGGKYYVHRILGEGGMGTVFEAENIALGRAVAVKVLHPSQAKKRVAVKRFHQEARAAGAIGHPNICEVYDLGTLEDGSPYLVMEKLVGQTLADRIAAHEGGGGLPFDDVVDILTQVLSGLVAAHNKGIVHRDIKPENVFLTERVGIPPVAKLLDFGVSKMLFPEPGQRPEDLDLTRTGMVMGTPFYMSPEQARGDRNLDARVDLWACGVLLYEALTGKRPFHAANYNALLLQILSTKPRPARDLRPSIPLEFEVILGRAMARNRDERYRSATDFQRDLAQLRADVIPQSMAYAASRSQGSPPQGPPKSARPSPSSAAEARPSTSKNQGQGPEARPRPPVPAPERAARSRTPTPGKAPRVDPLAALPRLGGDDDNDAGGEIDSGTHIALHSSQLDSNEVDALLDAAPIPLDGVEGYDDIETEISRPEHWDERPLGDDDPTLRSKPNRAAMPRRRRPTVPDAEETVKMEGDPSNLYQPPKRR